MTEGMGLTSKALYFVQRRKPLHKNLNGKFLLIFLPGTKHSAKSPRNEQNHFYSCAVAVSRGRGKSFHSQKQSPPSKSVPKHSVHQKLLGQCPESREAGIHLTELCTEKGPLLRPNGPFSAAEMGSTGVVFISVQLA